MYVLGSFMWHDVPVEVRGQLVGIGSFVPPCGVWGLNIGLATNVFTHWTTPSFAFYSLRQGFTMYPRLLRSADHLASVSECCVCHKLVPLHLILLIWFLPLLSLLLFVCESQFCLPCGCWDSNSGPLAWQQVPSPALSVI